MTDLTPKPVYTVYKINEYKTITAGLYKDMYNALLHSFDMAVKDVRKVLEAKVQEEIAQFEKTNEKA